MCDVAGLFLSKLHDVSKEIQVLPAIESPWKRASSQSNSDGPSAAARVQHRMTMPVRSASGKDGQDFRPSALQSPATSQPNSISRSATPNGVRPMSQVTSREQSRDRTSTPVPGSAPSFERNQSKLAGRAAVVMGALYLQAGRWPDALKELERGSTVCRGLSDYLWHGKSLELIIACLLMHSWANLGFQIPQVCYPVTEKSNAARTTTGPGTAPTQTPADASASLRSLTKLLPDLCSTILTLYTRAANFTQEQLPQVLLFESSLRIVSVLSAIHVRGGTLDRAALDYFVDGRELQTLQNESRSSDGSMIRKHDLSAMLSQAMNMETEQLSSDEAVYVLISLVSRLSLLGLRRKQAFFIRELISIIIPSLVHARKVGAAEMGIHPAAGLSAFATSTGGDDISAKHQLDRTGLRPLLKAMMDIYAVYEKVPEDAGMRTTILPSRDRMSYIGDSALKIDVLRACVNVCEALPDLEGVIRFNVQLLHAVKGTLLMPEVHAIGGPLIPQEEQTRILNSIQRTVGAASKTGLGLLEAEYWDDCLVRDIERLEPPSSTKLRPHTKRDLDLIGASGVAKPKDPFIFNPFAKANAASKEDTTLVAGEPAQFRVTFQNTFDFDLEVDRLFLEAEGCGFEPIEQSLLIGPYCLQKIVMSGIPRSAGKLEVNGVTAHIRGCRQRYFPICKSRSETYDVHKTKAIGLQAMGIKEERPLSSDSAATAKKPPVQTSDAVLTMTVIEPQPIVFVKSPSLSQFAVMVIEGESKEVEISLQNTSKTTPVDFVLFTFQDSATRQVQTALSNKELNPADLYDLQLMLLEKPALRLKSELNASSSRIHPGATSTFLVEVTGKPGLLDGTVQIDYGYLGKDSNEMTQNFFTRQLTIPITVTVNAGLELLRCNVLPFAGDFAWANRQAHLRNALANDKLDTLSPLSIRSKSSSPGARRSGNQFTSLLSRLGIGNYGDDHCLVLLDLRNSWPYPLTVNIQVREQIPKLASASDAWSRAYGVHETIQPGHTSRSVLLLPRFFLTDPHEPVPTIGNTRQFVVSSSKLSPELEMANREMFWFREELIKHLRGAWTEDSTGRQGSIDLRRAVRLNARMIEAMRIQDIELSMHVEALNKVDQESSPTVHQMSRCHFALRTDEFATLCITIRNRSNKPLSAILRLQPTLRDQPHTAALDLVKRFAWTGMLQRTIHPPIGPGEQREAKLGVMALCEGNYEIGASVEELSVVPASETIVGTSPSRRIWHSREPCMIDASEEDLF